MPPTSTPATVRPLVLAGELYRTVTALTLHADLPHVAGNALFGGFFLAALAGLGSAVRCSPSW